MATTTNAIPTTAPPRAYPRPGIYPLVNKTYTFTSAVFSVADDEVDFGPIAPYTFVTGVKFRVTDLDTDGTPALTLDILITDGTTTYKLAEAITTAQAGGMFVGPIAGQSATALANYGPVLADRDEESFRVKVRVVTAPDAVVAAGNMTLILEGGNTTDPR